MNKLQSKAAELVAMANALGVEADTTETPNYIRVDFYQNLKSGKFSRIQSYITETDTGRVSVKSRERVGRRTETIALKNLPDWVGYIKAYEIWRAEKAQRITELEKGLAND